MAGAAVDIGSLVTMTPGVYGGRPCLEGTRFPILQLAVLHNERRSPEWIAEQYGLPLVHIYAGVAYYLANRAAIDRELAEERTAYDAALGDDTTAGA